MEVEDIQCYTYIGDEDDGGKLDVCCEAKIQEINGSRPTQEYFMLSNLCQTSMRLGTLI